MDQYLEDRAARHLHDTLVDDVGAMVGDLAGPPRTVYDDIHDLLVDVDILAGAHRAVLDIEMFTSNAVADALGVNSKNRRESASRLRASGALLGVPNPSGRGFLYPRFQFDLAHRRLHPTVVAVNRALDAVGEPWPVASWWVSHHGRLGATAPMDLIATERESDLLVLVDLAPPHSAFDARTAAVR